MTDATSRLIRECRLLGAANVIVSANVAVRRDGLPYARQRTPEARRGRVLQARVGARRAGARQRPVAPGRPIGSRFTLPPTNGRSRFGTLARSNT